MVAVAADDVEATLAILNENGETATVIGNMVAPGTDADAGQILIG